MIVYDLEIEKMIPDKKPRDPRLEYCQGWSDKQGMGISVICTYDMKTGTYNVFLKDNFLDFFTLISGRILVGFNSLAFDDKVIREVLSVSIKTDYDILVEIWTAENLGPKWSPRHKGYSLDDCLRANGIPSKTGSGADAPKDWQLGKHGRVVDYCLQDVRVTKDLMWTIIRNKGVIRSPKGRETLSPLRLPDGIG